MREEHCRATKSQVELKKKTGADSGKPTTVPRKTWAVDGGGWNI